jgi:hypothetical protein
MRELTSVLKTLPHDGPLESLGSLLNGVCVYFGGLNTYHRGRGFEMANSIVRDRRPEGKPLFVFIDSSVDTSLLEDEGYAHVGKISIEGKASRNWDQAYKTAVAEALLWDVDILLISGGMKGVTIGSNSSFPGGAGAYSQANYSFSLLGSFGSGITEGKGEAVLSAESYRFAPGRVHSRRIPQALYERIRVRPQVVRQSGSSSIVETSQTDSIVQASQTNGRPGIKISQTMYDMAGFGNDQQVGCVTIVP